MSELECPIHRSIIALSGQLAAGHGVRVEAPEAASACHGPKCAWWVFTAKDGSSRGQCGIATGGYMLINRLERLEDILDKR